jgi:hypothetical protein
MLLGLKKHTQATPLRSLNLRALSYWLGVASSVNHWHSALTNLPLWV